MMVWLFQNLHNQAVSTVDNKTYPMYLLFHVSIIRNMCWQKIHQLLILLLSEAVMNWQW